MLESDDSRCMSRYQDLTISVNLFKFQAVSLRSKLMGVPTYNVWSEEKMHTGYLALR